MSSTNEPFDLWSKSFTEELNNPQDDITPTTPHNPGDEPPDVYQDDSTLTMVTSWRYKLSLASLVSLAVIVVAVALVYMVPKSPSVDLSCSNRLYCHRILSLVRQVESIPLPLPVCLLPNIPIMDIMDGRYRCIQCLCTSIEGKKKAG